MTRFDMANKGFFVLISRECFDLCEQLGIKNQDTHILRAFSSAIVAKNYAKKNHLVVIYE